MDEFSDPTPIATAKQFKRALTAMHSSGQITKSRIAMLKAHYRAPRHTISTHQLGIKMGYRSRHLMANAQYGRFAHRLADELNYIPGPFSDRQPHWWRTIAYGKNASQYMWIMRPELAQALRELGWLRR
jgi:predicted HNH restriction endonuclease